MADHLVLIGMMGSGKSTTAQMAARRLGREHVDTDDTVVLSTGESILALFEDRGEAWFRREEAGALRAVLARPGPLVVSVGGGAVLDAENRRALSRAGTVVWLRARPATLARRVGNGRTRPLLGAGPESPADALARIDAERRPLYESVADAVVDVDDLAPDAVVERVLAVSAAVGEGAGRGAAGGPVP